MDKVLLVIPAYNEEKNIERVVDQLTESFPELTGRLLSGRDEIRLEKGYRYAIQFDGDGQHRPEFIKTMREKMDEGYDIVIGSRFVTEKKDWSFRMLGSRIIGAAIRLTTGAHIKDPTSGMRLFNRKMIGEFALNLNYGPEPDTISFLIHQGARVAEVQVTIDDRTAGESYLKPVTAVKYMVRMLLSILVIQNFRKRQQDAKTKG